MVDRGGRRAGGEALEVELVDAAVPPHVVVGAGHRRRRQAGRRPCARRSASGPPPGKGGDGVDGERAHVHLEGTAWGTLQHTGGIPMSPRSRRGEHSASRAPMTACDVRHAPRQTPMDRRSFLKVAAATAGLGAVGARAAWAAEGPVNLALPSLGTVLRPSRTPIEHVLVVMMENRSVDHFLGWYGAENPDFDGIQTARFRDLRKGRRGPMVSTEDWGRDGRNDFDGRGFADPDHGWDNGRLVRNGGLHGRLAAPEDRQRRAHPQHLRGARPPGVGAAHAWVADLRPLVHSSCSDPPSPTATTCTPARRRAIKNNDLPPEMAGQHPEWALGWDWPTVWDVCKHAFVSSAYYFSNLPETAFWGPRHLDITRHVSELYRRSRARHAPPGVGDRPVVHRSGGHRQRRPPARRHPARPDVPVGPRRGVHPVADLPQGRDDHHLRRGRRLLGPRRPAPGRRRAGHAPRTPAASTTSPSAGSGSRPRSSRRGPRTTGSTTPPTSTPRSCGSWPTTGAFRTRRQRIRRTNSLMRAFRGFRLVPARRRLHAVPDAPSTSRSPTCSTPTSTHSREGERPRLVPDVTAEERPAPAGRHRLVRRPRGRPRPPVRGRLPHGRRTSAPRCVRGRPARRTPIRVRPSLEPP